MAKRTSVHHKNRTHIGNQGGGGKWSNEERMVLLIIRRCYDISDPEVAILWHRVFPQMRHNRRAYSSDTLRDEVNARWSTGRSSVWQLLDRPNDENDNPYTMAELNDQVRLQRIIERVAAGVSTPPHSVDRNPGMAIDLSRFDGELLPSELVTARLAEEMDRVKEEVGDLSDDDSEDDAPSSSAPKRGLLEEYTNSLPPEDIDSEYEEPLAVVHMDNTPLHQDFQSPERSHWERSPASEDLGSKINSPTQRKRKRSPSEDSRSRETIGDRMSGINNINNASRPMVSQDNEVLIPPHFHYRQDARRDFAQKRTNTSTTSHLSLPTNREHEADMGNGGAEVAEQDHEDSCIATDDSRRERLMAQQHRADRILARYVEYLPMVHEKNIDTAELVGKDGVKIGITFETKGEKIPTNSEIYQYGGPVISLPCGGLFYDAMVCNHRICGPCQKKGDVAVGQSPTGGRPFIHSQNISHQDQETGIYYLARGRNGNLPLHAYNPRVPAQTEVVQVAFKPNPKLPADVNEDARQAGINMDLMVPKEYVREAVICVRQHCPVCRSQDV